MNTKELIKMANDAYYATEYDKAIMLYLQVLELAPKNKHALKQLKKAEFNRSLKATTPELPTQAIQLYKRSRSFITAGDLVQAKKYLLQAIAIAKDAGVDFPRAQELLDNLTNALTAESYKKKAFEELDTQQWAKALDNLSSANNVDQTDETSQLMLSHLQSLLKAQNLVSQLRSGVSGTRNRSKIKKEIQEIIERTNETSALSTLWQDVVRDFGGYNSVSVSQELIGIVILLVITSGIVGGLSALYYWSTGAFIALAILTVAFILLISGLSKK